MKPKHPKAEEGELVVCSELAFWVEVDVDSFAEAAEKACVMGALGVDGDEIKAWAAEARAFGVKDEAAVGE
jgi:hypothetical protein